MKGNAESTFIKLAKDVSLEILLEGVKNSPQLHRDDSQFIPNAQAWLNGQGWLDEPEGQPKKPNIKNHNVYS